MKEGAYRSVYQRSLQDPDAFWAEAAEALDWTKRWDQILDKSNPPFYRWFPGALCNTSYNCLDRHIAAGRGAQTALIYDSPVTQQKRSYSYTALRDAVALLAGVLAAHGVTVGDRVIIYMPMIPEAVMAMLACARLGAIHCVVFGGFAARELAVRIDDSKPRLILSASGGIEPSRIVYYKPLLDAALVQAVHQPEGCIILQRPEIASPEIASPEIASIELMPGRDYDWEEEMAAARPHEPVPVAATDPLYILYTSGTTGQPKGVVRDNGGHMVALYWTMAHHYDIRPGEVWWSASDIGWVVGHSYIVYAPLLHGNTTILFEGKPVGTPDAGAFWRVISEHKVAALFTAPTAIRAIKRDDPDGSLISSYDLSDFRTLFLAGERCDPPTLGWAIEKLKKPVIDHWWQTETGWAICGNPLGIEALPIKPGAATVPMPGYEVQILNDNHQPSTPGEIGEIVIKLPLPPGSFPTLWQATTRYRESYLDSFPGYYKTGDAGLIDEDGYVFVMARTDDVINVAGHRLSTGGIEEVLAAHPAVAECAVVGVSDTLKGQMPLGFLILKSGIEISHSQISAEIIAMVRQQIGAVAAFKQVVIVSRLPKTRSGKILRGTMQKIADGMPYVMPPTIEDPAALEEIKAVLSI